MAGVRAGKAMFHGMRESGGERGRSLASLMICLHRGRESHPNVANTATLGWGTQQHIYDLADGAIASGELGYEEAMLADGGAGVGRTGA